MNDFFFLKKGIVVEKKNSNTKFQLIKQNNTFAIFSREYFYKISSLLILHAYEKSYILLMVSM